MFLTYALAPQEMEGHAPAHVLAPQAFTTPEDSLAPEAFTTPEDSHVPVHVLAPQAFTTPEDSHFRPGDRVLVRPETEPGAGRPYNTEPFWGYITSKGSEWRRTIYHQGVSRFQIKVIEEGASRARGRWVMCDWCRRQNSISVASSSSELGKRPRRWDRLSDNDKRYLKRKASEALDADVQGLVQVNDTLQRAAEKKDKELQLEQNKAIVREARLRKECEQEFERRHEFVLADLETMKRHLRNDSTNVEELKNLRLVVAALAKEKISLVAKCERDVKAVRKEKDVVVAALTRRKRIWW